MLMQFIRRCSTWPRLLTRVALLGAVDAICALAMGSGFSSSAFAQTTPPAEKPPEVSWTEKSQYYIIEDGQDAITLLQLDDSIARGAKQVATLVHLTRQPPRSGETRTYDVECARSLMSAVLSSKISSSGPGKEVWDQASQVDLTSGTMEKLIKNLVCIPSTELDPDLLYEGSLAEFAKEFWR